MAFGSPPSPGENNFPQPNFVNPTTRVPVVLGLTISTIILVLLLTAGRLYARAYIKISLGPDDWMILVAAILATILSILGGASCLYGLGYHFWDRRPEWTEPYYKIGFAIQIIYPLCVGLTKMSVCQTYLRIFPSETFRKFSHSMSTFVTAYTLVCVILMLTQCHPLNGYWDEDIQITCVNMHAVMISMGVINTLTDFFIYLIPAPSLWRIQLPLRQRLGLVFVFTCGLVVCVAGVFRLIYLNRYFTNIDLYWDAALTTSLSIVEVNIGIVCGCLPCIKPLLKRFLPSLFTTHSVSRSPYDATTIGGNSSRMRDLSPHHVGKKRPTSREGSIDEAEESWSDESSTRDLMSPVLWFQSSGKVERGSRRERRLPSRGIVVDQTIVVERS